MISRFTILLACLMSMPSISQIVARNETTLLYRQEVVGTATIHTNGWGFGIRYGKQLTVDKKLLFSFDIASMKHPKETRVINPSQEDARGYIYGKTNSLTLLRPHIGQRRSLFPKLRDRGVELGYVWTAGPTLGLVKPIYLEICIAPTSPGNQGCIPSTEKYNPLIHTPDEIKGKAPGTKGIGEIKIQPGLSAKFGFYFEYSPLEEGFRAVEVGVSVDAFNKRIPILAIDNNKFIYQSFYVSFVFGKKMF